MTVTLDVDAWTFDAVTVIGFYTTTKVSSERLQLPATVVECSRFARAVPRACIVLKINMAFERSGTESVPGSSAFQVYTPGHRQVPRHCLRCVHGAREEHNK